MKVAALIEELQQYDAEAEVHFQYNYGDHWKTQVAPKVKSVEDGSVVHSEYHSMDRVIDEDEDVKRHLGAVRKVVLLS